MLKFKFDYQQNTLAYQTEVGNIWYQLTEEQSFTSRFNQPGFKLKEGWMVFTVYQKKIQVFYKNAAYFKKNLPKECPVSFEFSETDKVEKARKSWVKGAENGF